MDKKLLVFSPTKDLFEKALQDNIIDLNCVGFIENPKLIWARNNYFPCPYTVEQIDELVQNLKEYSYNLVNPVEASVSTTNNRITNLIGIDTDTFSPISGSNYTKNSQDILHAIYDLDRTLSNKANLTVKITGLNGLYTAPDISLLENSTSLNNADYILAENILGLTLKWNPETSKLLLVSKDNVVISETDSFDWYEG